MLIVFHLLDDKDSVRSHRAAGYLVVCQMLHRTQAIETVIMLCKLLLINIFTGNVLSRFCFLKYLKHLALIVIFVVQQIKLQSSRSQPTKFPKHLSHTLGSAEKLMF